MIPSIYFYLEKMKQISNVSRDAKLNFLALHKMQQRKNLFESSQERNNLNINLFHKLHTAGTSTVNIKITNLPFPSRSSSSFK